MVVDKKFKDFEIQYNKLCRTHDRQMVWSDFISLVGNSINLAYTGSSASSHEIERIKSKYTTVELQAMIELMKIVEDSYRHNPNQDYLGHIALSTGLISTQNGKHFSPIDVSTLVAKIAFESIKESITEKGWATINDPTCGSGSLLIAFANECMRQQINYENHVLFIGQDINYTTALTCFIQLTLLNCPGYVVIGDTLTNPITTQGESALYGPASKDITVYYTPQFYNDVWAGRRQWDHLFQFLKHHRRQSGNGSLQGQ